ncbi:MAG: hypothetical protein ACOVN5_10340 [Aquidulcibacter sp.]|jgi:hypothetical protein
MITLFADYFALASKWSNDNQGVVSLAFFIVTIALGWASGIFSALRRKPKFRLSLIDGPTFCCTFPVGKELSDHEVHRTGIALYLNIANIGSAASSIQNVSVGYHWHLRPFSLQWLRYTLGWFWLRNQAVALADFQVAIGGNIKVFPFLTQRGNLYTDKAATFLQAGQSTTGVVYFEQSDSWGGCFPSPRNNMVAIKVCVEAVFRRKHTAKFRVPFVSMKYARNYNPSFGTTLAELHGETRPIDTSI